MLQYRRALFLSAMVALAPGCGGSDEPAGGGSDAAAPDAPGVDTEGGESLVEDPCPVEPPACAAPPVIARGSGLRALDRCAFPLVLEEARAVVELPAELPKVTLADIAADLNREAVRVAAPPGSAPGVRNAWGWNAGDQGVAYWIPQGITGSFDGVAGSGTVNGRKLVLVSWYYSRAEDTGSTVEKGVRIAIADVTDPAAVRYRFALLVEPVRAADGRPTFRSVPVHAGGLAWVGNRLYVPITGSGLRVFDLAHILALDGLEDKIGYDPATQQHHAHSYAYAIPELARYTSTGSCAPRFSFVALDRSSTPPSLITGEYDADAVTGRLHRWPLNGAGALQPTTRHRTIPDGAWLSAESHIQGAAARDGTFWLSSSRPAAGAGELVRTKLSTRSATLGWSDSPEDLALDPQANSMWSLTEAVDARYFFEVAVTALD